MPNTIHFEHGSFGLPPVRTAISKHTTKDDVPINRPITSPRWKTTKTHRTNPVNLTSPGRVSFPQYHTVNNIYSVESEWDLSVDSTHNPPLARLQVSSHTGERKKKKFCAKELRSRRQLVVEWHLLKRPLQVPFVDFGRRFWPIWFSSNVQKFTI